MRLIVRGLTLQLGHLPRRGRTKDLSAEGGSRRVLMCLLSYQVFSGAYPPNIWPSIKAQSTDSGR